MERPEDVNAGKSEGLLSAGRCEPVIVCIPT